MEKPRCDPDEMLRRVKKELEERKRGHLKIFFGYAAGVGKTYAMLKAAHGAAHRGVDVVVGYVEPHDRPRTAQLLSGLEAIPAKRVTHGGIVLHEFDLDRALERKPQLLLVDELAHTNGDGCRHRKRHQDIAELLNAGISVYTTVNVQHIESLNDMVTAITGVTVRERIPDHVFDRADQVELVDIEPEELMERLGKGEVYGKTQAEKALGNFFTSQNLTALRELALRRCADRVNRMVEAGRDSMSGGYYTDEHILVCLSSSPTNAKIIRTAARMASAFRGSFTALFVETPAFVTMSEENRSRLRQNIHLAGQLGASVETVCGDDIAFQISEFARLSGVSKIVLGRSSAKRKLWPGTPTLTEKITALSPNLDIYIIPEKDTPPYRAKQGAVSTPNTVWQDIFKSALALAAASLVGLLFYRFGFSEANIITAYILGVLVTAISTSRRIYSLVSSAVSVLTFNFLFTDPRFSFNAYDASYPATFLFMFIAAFLTSTVAVRLKQQARQSAETAYRTKILFDTNQLISNERDTGGIIAVTCKQLSRLLGKDILFYGVQDDRLTDPLFFSVGESPQPGRYQSEHEKTVATWVYHNNKHAGATTNTLGNAGCLYLSVRVGQEVYGVVGVAVEGTALDAMENSVMLSILGECALALKNEAMSRQREEAALLAKNEQLRANLLRSISHDLRTPLTTISGNAGILLESEGSLDAEKRRGLYTSIYDDALWLINLVENLLSVTRIEDNSMKLRTTTELMDEVIAEAMRHISRKSIEHSITVKPSDGFALVKMDARLMMQVVINLVDNAIKYTPQGSAITIETRQEGGKVMVSVSDDGPGISDESKKRIFDMFYTANATVADSRRSLGLGLALCKSIVTAHGGELTVSDRVPRGTVFTFTLPAEEVCLHE